MVTPPSAFSATEQVSVKRVFSAPIELVFQMWSDPRHLEQWFAPPGCTIEFYKYDFRVGGTFRSRLVNPQVKTCLCEAEFLEIVPPSKISYRLYFVDEDGSFMAASQVNMDLEWPDETVVTVSLVDLGGKTELTLQQTVSAVVAQRTGALPSWLLMLDRLEAAMGVPNA